MVRQNRRWQDVVSAIYILLYIVIIVILIIEGNFHNVPSPCTTVSSKPVELTMYADIGMRDWIHDVVGDFNKGQTVACNNKPPVHVSVTDVSTSQSMQDILDGHIQPDIWIPAGSVWLGLLNQEWQKKNGSNGVSTGVTHTMSATILASFRQNSSDNLMSTNAADTPSLVKSPVVIAMWKPMAVALGWPNILWADLRALSINPRGWAAYGHQEWGSFKFGHTNPNNSDSGLASIISENYAAVHKVNGLTLDDVNNEKTQHFVSDIESSIINYGDSTDALAREMFTKGPSYLSAVVMNESMVVQANMGKYGHLPQPVVAVYPKDGTVISDYPFAIPQASWVTPTQRNAALSFRSFLLDSTQQRKVPLSDLRPATYAPPNDGSTPINSNNGVDTSQPATPLPSPSPGTTTTGKKNWDQQERNKLDVMLVLDRSGSMNDHYGDTTKITGAKAGLKEFVNDLLNPDDQHPDDQLGFTVFSDLADILSPITPLGPKSQQVLDSIDSVSANGATLLWDTIAAQQATLQNMPSKDIKVLIVLTDGQDTISQTSPDQLANQVSLKGKDAGEGVRIFTIAYGDQGQIDVADLKKIATAAGGMECPGNSQNISNVYNQIKNLLIGTGSGTSQGTGECRG